MQRPSVDLPQPDSPDEAERLAARDSQVDAVDGAQHVVPAACARRRERVVEREVHREAADLEQRLSHRRSPAPAHVARSASWWMQAVARSAPIGPQRRIAGRAVGVRERAARVEAAARRAARRGRAASRGSTRACRARSSKSGTERSRLSVYGWRGSRNTSSTVPVSTTCARVHHGDALAGLGDHREVVGDEARR